MSLAEDLLDQADMLARYESGKPKQATLRRAVSTAYYAVFHLLVEDAVARLVPSRAQPLRDQLARVFGHAEMKKAAQAFANQTANPWVTLAGVVPPDLRDVADLFVDLQDERHEADYNVARTFTRSNVTVLLARARTGFAQWRAVKSSMAAEAFLLALLGRGR